jgi:D-serine deaminase-like pyridoxal phosphate-dependent protein
MATRCLTYPMTAFASQDILNVFWGYPVPEELFDALRVDKSIDRFSWIVDDYLELEGALQGITKKIVVLSLD